MNAVAMIFSRLTTCLALCCLLPLSQSFAQQSFRELVGNVSGCTGRQGQDIVGAVHHLGW